MTDLLTIDSLQQQLSQHYELLCFVDLAELSRQHKTVFEIFKSIHRQEFSANQRAVFYSSHKPSQEMLDHIQLSAARIDISNWFIMICCPDDISAELESANRAYGYDEHAIKWYPIEIESTESLSSSAIYPRKNLCYAPFNSVSIGIDGSVKPCCKYRESMGNLRDHTLEEIFHGEKMQAVRDDMLAGRKHNHCSTCWENEHKGSTSLRKLVNLKYQDLSDIEHIDTPKIYNLSLAPTTVCNFKCRICDENASSSIAAEEMAFAETDDKKKFFRLKIKGADNIKLERYVELVRPVLGDLGHLHIYGGEPLLAKGLIEWLEEIIASGHSKHINFEINTNASIWSPRFVDISKSFKSFEACLSIDDLGRRFELQRGSGESWSTIDENIQKWAGLKSDTVGVKITPTVNLQNLFYLDQLIDYCESRNLEIIWTYLEEPEFFSIDRAPKHLREKVIEKYRDHQNPELRGIASRLSGTPIEFDRQFLIHTQKLDQRRNQDFVQAHAELFDLLNKDIQSI